MMTRIAILFTMVCAAAAACDQVPTASAQWQGPIVIPQTPQIQQPYFPPQLPQLQVPDLRPSLPSLPPTPQVVEPAVATDAARRENTPSTSHAPEAEERTEEAPAEARTEAQEPEEAPIALPAPVAEPAHTATPEPANPNTPWIVAAVVVFAAFCLGRGSR